ncbi:MAG TPA: CPBP family intramembrane glutamic endopeptidase [Rhizomicrobium sp.]|nr:CPBP family intramembrane glutamic endopeptidase [Rhizomicrobium sp.]
MSLALAHPEPVKRGALRTLGIAIGSGVALIVAGEGLWIGMLAAYSRQPTTFPWFVPAMAAILAAAAAWMKWGSWPSFGAQARRDGVRLNAVPLKTFLLALVAGWSTFFAGAGAYIAYRMQSGLGGEVPMSLPPEPKVAIVVGLAMAAIVAGVLEEVSVRGFIQGRLERAFGVAPAIVVSGLVWALFHTNHSYFDTTPLNIAIWFGIFLTVSAMLGTIAHRTNSVLPGIVIHAGFDSTYFVPAGLLPLHAPLAFVESLATPQTFEMIGAGLAVVAFLAWAGFFRATRR